MIIKPSFSEKGNGILEEYPRPQMKRNSYISLNGSWDYAFSSKKETESYDGEITVPFCPESELSGVKRQLGKNEYLIYRRDFYLSEDFNEGRIILNVGACDQVCWVYVNEKYAGEHEGGYLSFSLDISEYVFPGRNEIRIVVSDDADSDVYGRGKQRYKSGGIWYTATSGIWQSVWLESVPLEYISKIRITPDLDGKTVSVICFSSSQGEVSIDYECNGKKMIATGRANEPISLDASGCVPWSPESPELYPFRIKFGRDSVESYFGLRKFSSGYVGKAKYFMLNNSPAFYNGLLDQGYFEKGFYTPKSNKTMYEELLAVKELGYNMLRKHIKVESLLWYYYCDCLGITVWQDMVNGGAEYPGHRINLGPFINMHLNDRNYRRMQRGNPRSREFYLKEAKGTIDQLYNTVSISLWTLFNEAWGQFDSVKNYEILKNEDSTRLYDVTSGWQDCFTGDVCSRHVYFMNINLRLPFSRIKGRVHAVTEFGGYSFAGENGEGKTMSYKTLKNKAEYQNAYEKLYRKQVFKAIRKHHISATVYTQLSDVEGEINGILSTDRKLKLDKERTIALNRDLEEFFKNSL